MPPRRFVSQTHPWICPPICLYVSLPWIRDPCYFLALCVILLSLRLTLARQLRERCARPVRFSAELCPICDSKR
ncbi:hypothetical protein BKA93DRAFT_494222 [Sparassis latifolia]